MRGWIGLCNPFKTLPQPKLGGLACVLAELHFLPSCSLFGLRKKKLQAQKIFLIASITSSDICMPYFGWIHHSDSGCTYCGSISFPMQQLEIFLIHILGLSVFQRTFESYIGIVYTQKTYLELHKCTKTSEALVYREKYQFDDFWTQPMQRRLGPMPNSQNKSLQFGLTTCSEAEKSIRKGSKIVY